MFLFRRKLREGTTVMISEMTQKAFSNYSGRVVSQPSYSLWFGLGKMCMFLGLFSLLVKPSLKKTNAFTYCPVWRLPALACGLLPVGYKSQVGIFDCFIQEPW